MIPYHLTYTQRAEPKATVRHHFHARFHLYDLGYMGGFIDVSRSILQHEDGERID